MFLTYVAVCPGVQVRGRQGGGGLAGGTAGRRLGPGQRCAGEHPVSAERTSPQQCTQVGNLFNNSVYVIFINIDIDAVKFILIDYFSLKIKAMLLHLLMK